MAALVHQAFARPDGVDKDGSSCRRRLQAPRTTEVTWGVEREIVRGIAIGGDFVYRRFANQFERFETNRVWNDAGTELDRTGDFRNGRSQTVDDMETPDGAVRDYT